MQYSNVLLFIADGNTHLFHLLIIQRSYHLILCCFYCTVYNCTAHYFSLSWNTFLLFTQV